MSMMQVKVISTPRGRDLMLCDADGTPLPNQRAVALKQEAGKTSTVTVTFVVDGKRIALVD